MSPLGPQAASSPQLCPEPPVTFLAQPDVPLIEENQLSFAPASRTLTFDLLQLTDVTTATSFSTMRPTRRSQSFLLGQLLVSRCPARDQKGRAVNGGPSWYPHAQTAESGECPGPAQGSPFPLRQP